MLRTAGFALAAAAALMVSRAWALRRSGQRVLRAYFDAWESGEPQALGAVVAEDYRGHVHAIAGTEERDRESLAEQVVAHAATFAESRFAADEVVASDGRVAARVRMRAVHREEQRRVEMDGLVLLHVAGGRIAEEWASWDYAGLARQLGVELAAEES